MPALCTTTSVSQPLHQVSFTFSLLICQPLRPYGLGRRLPQKKRSSDNIDYGLLWDTKMVRFIFTTTCHLCSHKTSDKHYRLLAYCTGAR